METWKIWNPEDTAQPILEGTEKRMRRCAKTLAANGDRVILENPDGDEEVFGGDTGDYPEGA